MPTLEGRPLHACAEKTTGRICREVGRKIKKRTFIIRQTIQTKAIRR